MYSSRMIRHKQIYYRFNEQKQKEYKRYYVHNFKMYYNINRMIKALL